MKFSELPKRLESIWSIFQNNRVLGILNPIEFQHFWNGLISFWISMHFPVCYVPHFILSQDSSHYHTSITRSSKWGIKNQKHNCAQLLCQNASKTHRGLLTLPVSEEKTNSKLADVKESPLISMDFSGAWIRPWKNKDDIKITWRLPDSPICSDVLPSPMMQSRWSVLTILAHFNHLFCLSD